jgi:hypothetical protein
MHEKPSKVSLMFLSGPSSPSEEPLLCWPLMGSHGVCSARSRFGRWALF